jgi:hypothetical protein
VLEDDELDFAELINRESMEIQKAVGSGAEEVRAEIRDASVWQRPDYTLQVLVTHLVSGRSGRPGRDLTVTLLTAGALIVGRLTNSIKWQRVVLDQMNQVLGGTSEVEPQLADDLSRLLAASGMRDPSRDAYGEVTRYFLLDATIEPLGAGRSACLPPRPWIVQARHVIGWTLGDAAVKLG